MILSLLTGADGPVSSALSARTLDVAKGVLVVLRGCDTAAAFEELVAASRRHRLPVFALADALVSMAAGPARTGGQPSAEVARAIEQEWGPLLTPPRAGLAE
ncbi:ANTAR domain-containing protein [Mycobacterium sp. 1274756.6]|uniref:ANTAR domain-containing protein n=1 Tax=Mycobacterium sp. 1274756.6 TaxID=1834076 RepID=UPI0009EDD531|nr:ANTAR domain-containing protein [Mycobacterium sp. 1274756.6]